MLVTKGGEAAGHPVRPTIIRALPTDAEALADLHLRSRRAAVPAIPPPVHDDDEVRWWFAQVVLEEHEVWLAERPTGDVVGLMVLAGDWIDQLYLDPAWTGRGLGGAFVDLAKELRPGGLQLWTFQSNVGAQRFYERHGFVAEERTDGSGNEEREPDIRYVWRPRQASPAVFQSR